MLGWTMPSSSASPERRQFRAASLRTGAYEFIPLPFVDDWMIGRERRKVVRAILDQRGLGYDMEVPKILAGGGQSLLRRLGSMARGAVMKPLRKLFRTVFFWLTARRAARNVVATYFLARFLHHPDLAGGVEHLGEPRARQLAAIFEEVSKNLDLRALGDAVRRVTGLFAAHPDKHVRTEEVTDAIESEAPGFIGDFDRLVSQRLARPAG